MTYFIPHSQIPIDPSEYGYSAQAIIGDGTGATNLTVRRIEVDPGGSVPMHVHPNSEEGMLVLGGELEATVGNEVAMVKAGFTVIAPLGVRHRMVNRSGEKAVLLGIFPTVNPVRDLVKE